MTPRGWGFWCDVSKVIALMCASWHETEAVWMVVELRLGGGERG